jgi:DNA polymerase III subunit gamma/tau
MSYTVLARRYRSASFDEIIGQEQIAQTLTKAIETGRIAHAYLFCGARGTGKTSTARILAKCLNCMKASAATAKPCSKCDSCLAIARGDDMDVLEIDAASNTGVDNVRELIANAHFRPARARWKVYIIDEVHMLSKNAFNALLKTLEEPPEHVKFILATTEPEKVPATILSRCQRYDFRNISTRQIAEHLAAICKKEKAAVEEDALMLVARSAAGSMRDALSLLERLLSIGESPLTLAAAESLLGLPRWQSLLELGDAIGKADVGRTLTCAGALLSAGMSADALLAALAEHLRNLLILRTCPADSDLVEAAGAQLADLRKQSEKFDSAVLVQDIAVLEEVRRQIRQGYGGRALLDAALARLAMSEQFASVGQLLDRLDGGAPPPPEKKKAVELALNIDVPPPPPRPRPAPPIQNPQAVSAEPPAPPAKITAEVVAQLEKDPLIGLLMRELGGRPIKIE